MNLFRAAALEEIMVIVVIGIDQNRNDQHGEGKKIDRGRRIEKADGVFAFGKKLHDEKSQGDENEPQGAVESQQIQKNRQQARFFDRHAGIQQPDQKQDEKSEEHRP